MIFRIYQEDNDLLATMDIVTPERIPLAGFTRGLCYLITKSSEEQWHYYEKSK